MTTRNPQLKARFFVMLDTSNQLMFTRGDQPITFTLSAGTKFPSDMSILMKKTGRYLSTTSSLIQGVSEPKCEGDDCECIYCNPDGCKDQYCLEKITSSTSFQCNKESCTRTNDMKYYMTPLYPATYLYLSEYNPKFRFIKFVPSQKIEKRQMDDITNKYMKDEIEKPVENNQNGGVKFPEGWSLPPGMTIPPGDFYPFVGTIPPDETPLPGWKVLPGMVIPAGGTFPPNMLGEPGTETNETMMPSEIQLPEFVVFSITYPSMLDFNTNEKFMELYQSVIPYNLGFLFFKEDRFLQHNIAVLQQILRVNGLPKTLLDPKKINMRNSSSGLQSVKSEGVVIERYDDIQLNDLTVPTSSQEDTDNTSDNLITPEPDDFVEKIEEAVVSSVSSVAITSTPPPTSTKLPTVKQQSIKKTTKKGLSTGAKVGIVVGIIAAVSIVYGMYSWKKKKHKSR